MQDKWNQLLNSLHILGYNLIVQPRTGGVRGGGVPIYLTDLYNYSIIPSQFSKCIFESVSTIVEIPSGKISSELSI